MQTGGLLRDRFTLAEKRRCFEFYERLTTHDSSLSMATFSIIAAEIGEADKAYRYFRGTARMDLDDTHGNTKDGLHMANMAGTWMDVTSGFAGMYAGVNGLSFKPTLPKALKRYAFTVAWQGRRIHVDISNDGAAYTLVSGKPIDILADGKTLRLA
jgi:alpha,alpha-trehalose phosphorylase